MKYIKSFLESKMNEYYSVGIVFWYNNKILLVHPTNRQDPGASIEDDEYIWSYPKGKVDDGENHMVAAIREVSEELDINLPPDFLVGLEEKEAYVGIKKNNIPEFRGIKHYMYFTYYLSDEEFEEYFDSKYEVSRDKLQLWEVDSAIFFDLEVAKKKLAKKIHKILEG
jgi:8-oxo-dGTP pyrophosphatase MutT (NUDIX family)